ncbi:hypothetical protein [Micromonospora sp. CPCC 206061]|uniref:hypothetical protein n=1 Tax=Micromonospora sp. CPCC 206061 TaxID=3122410 RepID=UPI003FA593AB
MDFGPYHGLIATRLTSELATGALPHAPVLPAVRADLLRRLGRHAEAAASYRQALALVATEPERRYLTRRLAELP